MSKILASMNNTAEALYRAGTMKKKDRDEVRALYLSSTKPINPEDIQAIRKKNGLTQEVFAAYLGVKVITIKKWESGENRPTGPARKLLQLIQQKGLDSVCLETDA